jgi:hypothetical protein
VYFADAATLAWRKTETTDAQRILVGPTGALVVVGKESITVGHKKIKLREDTMRRSARLFIEDITVAGAFIYLILLILDVDENNNKIETVLMRRFRVVNATKATDSARAPVVSEDDTPVVSEVSTPVVSEVSTLVVSEVSTPVVSEVSTLVVSEDREFATTLTV